MTHTSADVLERFEPLFAPKTIAVVGASATAMTHGNVFIRRMREFGYAGTMYPIHPSAQTIEGLPAFRSLGETPQPIDYAYIVVAAAQIPDMLRAAGGRVRYAHVISSGFPKSTRARTCRMRSSRRHAKPAAGCSVRTASGCIRRAGG